MSDFGLPVNRGVPMLQIFLSMTNTLIALLLKARISAAGRSSSVASFMRSISRREYFPRISIFWWPCHQRMRVTIDLSCPCKAMNHHTLRFFKALIAQACALSGAGNDKVQPRGIQERRCGNNFIGRPLVKRLRQRVSNGVAHARPRQVG